MVATEAPASHDADRMPPAGGPSAAAPAPFRVVMITAVGSIGYGLKSLGAAFEACPITELPEPSSSAPGPCSCCTLTFAEFGAQTRGDALSGASKRASLRLRLAAQEKAAAAAAAAAETEVASASGGPQEPPQQAQARPGPRTRTFGTQVTLAAWLWPERQRVSAKLFSNGRVQLAGLRDVSHGRRVLAHLARAMLPVSADTAQDAEALVTRAEQSLLVCLESADMELGFKVRREQLFRVARDRVGCVCLYEPCRYPGVRIYYMHNEDPAPSTAGACRCSSSSAAAAAREEDDDPAAAGGGVLKHRREAAAATARCGTCVGKGTGRGAGQCQRLSILVYQSGHVLLTGARCREHTARAAEFVRWLACNHRAEFEL